jgi:hypothetical protein
MGLNKYDRNFLKIHKDIFNGRKSLFSTLYIRYTFGASATLYVDLFLFQCYVNLL